MKSSYCRAAPVLDRVAGCTRVCEGNGARHVTNVHLIHTIRCSCDHAAVQLGSNLVSMFFSDEA